MTTIDITNITGLSYPYDIYVCDIYGNNCILIATVFTSIPPSNTILLPPQFNTSPSVGIKIITLDGCERFKVVECGNLIPFISIWNTTNISGGSSLSNQIQLPLESIGNYNFVVDWGDGYVDTITIWNQPETLHTYSTSGTYTITITGTIQGFIFNYTGDKNKLISISNWGTLNLGNSGNYFNGCTNLDLSSVADVLNLVGTTNMDFIFAECTSITTINNINLWDVSNVTTMVDAFVGATSFNDNINNWDVSSVVNMNSMFQSASSFNQPIDSWDVSNVTNFTSMFVGAFVFNQPLNSWNVSSCTQMINMFQSAFSFNQPINNWDVSNVTTMTNMFYDATDFNQNIDSWDVSNVTDMVNMFRGALSFNQPLNSWDVGNVTNMSQMFAQTPLFNQPLNSWDVSNVTNMSGMFNLSPSFNQPLNSWNVGNVTIMSSMFRGAILFNQDIGSWDVSGVTNMFLMFQGGLPTPHTFNNGGSPSISAWTTSSVTNMYGMFNGANMFNQDIGSWDVSNVTAFDGMFLTGGVFNNGGSPSISGWTINTSTNVSMFIMFGFSSFNQPIGSWNVSKVTNMSEMFRSNFAFNQNIGGWNISGVTSFNNFMQNKTFSDYSTTNLDAIYNGWSSLPSVKPLININFGTIKYTAGGSAGKAILQGSPNNWSISDGGI